MSRSNDETIQSMFFSREGRLNRLRYFKRTLVVNVISIAVAFVLAIPFIDEFGEVSSSYDYMLDVIFLLILVPEFFLDIRRLKDLDFKADSLNEIAGWKALCGALVVITSDTSRNDFMMILISLMLLGLTLYLLFAHGTHGENQYGEDPLGGE